MKEQNNKSFEQLAKDVQSKKRMQELAGITSEQIQERPAKDILQDMIAEINNIRNTVSTELRKRKGIQGE
jgi:hypothetical protein